MGDDDHLTIEDIEKAIVSVSTPYGAMSSFPDKFQAALLLRDAGAMSARTFLEFDTSGLPPDALITSVKLDLGVAKPPSRGRRTAEMDLRDFNDLLDRYSLAQQLQAAGEYIRRFGFGAHSSMDMLNALRKGTEPHGAFLDHLPVPDKRIPVTLDIEEYRLTLRYREKVTLRPRSPDVWKAVNWMKRTIHRAGGSIVTGTCATHVVRDTGTLLDTGVWVVYATCRYVPFGQTYGLQPWLPEQATPVLTVQGYMPEEEPDAEERGDQPG